MGTDVPSLSMYTKRGRSQGTAAPTLRCRDILVAIRASRSAVSSPAPNGRVAVSIWPRPRPTPPIAPAAPRRHASTVTRLLSNSGGQNPTSPTIDQNLPSGPGTAFSVGNQNVPSSRRGRPARAREARPSVAPNPMSGSNPDETAPATVAVATPPDEVPAHRAAFDCG